MNQKQTYETMDILQLRAAKFIREHAGEHLYRDREALIIRTINHLLCTSDYSYETAEKVTVRAYTEIEAQNQPCFIDVDQTTAFQVAVMDPRTKATRIFTVGDLMRLVRTPDQLVALPTPSKRAACAGHYL